jgi:hypothetical protein
VVASSEALRRAWVTTSPIHRSHRRSLVREGSDLNPPQRTRSLRAHLASEHRVPWPRPRFVYEQVAAPKLEANLRLRRWTHHRLATVATVRDAGSHRCQAVDLAEENACYFGDLLLLFRSHLVECGRNFFEVDLLGDILRSELRLLQRTTIHIFAKLSVGEEKFQVD